MQLSKRHLCKAVFCFLLMFHQEHEPHHHFAELELAGPDVLHEHLKRREAELCGQQVERLILHLFQLDSQPEFLHELHPQTSLKQNNSTSGWVTTVQLHTLLHCQSVQLTQSLCSKASSSAVDLSPRLPSTLIFFSICTKHKWSNWSAAVKGTLE